jgi:two-component system LytT family sensor kinase
MKYEMLIQAVNAALFTAGFYFSYHYLIKPLLYNGKVMKFILLYLLVTVVLSAISIFSVYEVYVIAKKKFFVENYWNEPVFFTSNYMLMLLVISSLLSFRFVKDKMQTQMMLENAEKEKISTELGFLKAQINPHFLFNSLNNILFLVDKSNRDARETLLRFSEMLRYQLYECSAESIEIEKELEYIRNYIEIQMLRKTDKYNCTLDVSENVKNFQIAPLLLIPIVENAFKHISNHAHRKNCISFFMDYQNGEYIFIASNDKDNSGSVNINESKGIGLANVKRRLDLLYEKRYNLETDETEDRFVVTVKIKIA